MSSKDKRGLSLWLMAGSVIFTAAMLIAYALTGTNTFTPVLSGKVLTLGGIAAAVGAVMCFIQIKNIKYVSYLIGLWAWLEFFRYNASYISNVFVGIDGNLLSVGFIVTTVCGLMGWLCALISAITQKTEVSK